MTAKNSAMNTRVQSLDTAIHDFGETGVLAHAGHLKTRIGQHFLCAAGAQYGVTEFQ